MWWKFLIVAVFSYLFGNFNSAITISRLKKQDIRGIGSGNPGTMNMSRNFGLKIGLLVFVLDVLKGVIPTLTAKLVFVALYGETFSGQPIGVAAELVAGFFVVFGHVFPAAYRFKGGKGIASTIGVLAVCNFRFSLISCACALAFIFITRMGAVGSFIATAPTAIASCVRLYYDYYVVEIQSGINTGYYVMSCVLLFAIIALTWIAHRENIKRLLSCEEHDTNWLQMLKDLILKKKIKKQKSGQ